MVSALHDVPNGAVWTQQAIQKRKDLIEGTATNSPTGLTWDVVESLPVSEDIKRQTGDWRDHIDNYKASIENIASCGVSTICYNFMPVLDWTRTDLRYELPDGARCMRFDIIDFAAFDIHILKRADAEKDFTAQIVQEADTRYLQMTEAEKKKRKEEMEKKRQEEQAAKK